MEGVGSGWLCPGWALGEVWQRLGRVWLCWGKGLVRRGSSDWGAARSCSGGEWSGGAGPTYCPAEPLGVIKLQVLLALSWSSIVTHVIPALSDSAVEISDSVTCWDDVGRAAGGRAGCCRGQGQAAPPPPFWGLGVQGGTCSSPDAVSPSLWGPPGFRPIVALCCVQVSATSSLLLSGEENSGGQWAECCFLRFLSRWSGWAASHRWRGVRQRKASLTNCKQRARLLQGLQKQTETRQKLHVPRPIA